MSGPGYQMQGSFSQVAYDVDLVLCIDATESMSSVIKKVKENALSMYKDVFAAAQSAHKLVRNFRVKLIIFRDYLADGEYAMQATEFMKLPENLRQFSDTLDGVVAGGGGDIPEDGLEALAYAIRSDWTAKTPGAKRRQIIAVWSDAPTHEIGFSREAPDYDHALPKTFAELTDWWGYPPVDDEWGDDLPSGFDFMHYESKRLILFTPDGEYWNTVANTWDNVIHYKSIAGNGLDEFEYQEIISLIVNSIC